MGTWPVFFILQNCLGKNKTEGGRQWGKNRGGQNRENPLLDFKIQKTTQLLSH